MRRVSIGDGRWFDADKAKTFQQDTYWDGSNHISCATDSQWLGERLYRTAGAVWILKKWSDYAGSRDSFMVVSDHDAAMWLIKNNHDEEEDCLTEYQELEIK